MKSTVGLIAATFAVLGIWLGLKLTGRQQKIVVKSFCPGRSGLETKAATATGAIGIARDLLTGT